MMTPLDEGLLFLRRMGAIMASPCALRDGGGLLGAMSEDWVRRL